ncbi:MAG TPA: DUF3302 domain-containing protein [Stenotrophomonas sp.]|jgi:hypothetical protein
MNCLRSLGECLYLRLGLALVGLMLLSPDAHASFLSGEALDTAANVIAWLALVVVPVVLISLFWIVHILPEKIAEKRRHPQLAAIKILCLLSLAFGGLLWPLAWLWAYTKPVLHKMAYGTDQDEHAHHGEALTPLQDAKAEPLGEASATPTTGSPQRASAQMSTTSLLDDDPWRRVELLERRLAAMEADAAARSRPPTPGEG